MYGDQVLALSATTTDENLWQIKLQGEEELQGLVLVYVDDILILAKREVVEAIYQWLVSDWKCSNLEWVEDGSLRLFGKELRVCGAGVHLSQAGYIRVGGSGCGTYRTLCTRVASRCGLRRGTGGCRGSQCTTGPEGDRRSFVAFHQKQARVGARCGVYGIAGDEETTAGFGDW